MPVGEMLYTCTEMFQLPGVQNKRENFSDLIPLCLRRVLKHPFSLAAVPQWCQVAPPRNCGDIVSFPNREHVETRHYKACVPFNHINHRGRGVCMYRCTSWSSLNLARRFKRLVASLRLFGGLGLWDSV